MKTLKIRIWDKLNKCFYFDSNDTIGKDLDYSELYSSDPSLLFQSLYGLDENFLINECIGLTDNSGAFIYEGDILQSPEPTLIDVPEVIEWWENKACFSLINPAGYYRMIPENINRHKIIGNIHENSELFS